MKLPAFRNLPVIVKEVFCRVGMDWRGKGLFINALNGLDSEIAEAVTKELKISRQDLHDITCFIESLDKLSVTGDHYLAAKILKLKIRITIEDCELIDDIPTEPES